MAAKPLGEVLAAIYVQGLGEDFYSLPPETQALHLGAAAEVIRELDAFSMHVEKHAGGLRLVKKPQTPAQSVRLPTAADARRLHLRQLEEARMSGFEGESCSDCGAMRMVRSGYCLKCMACGSTTGCS
jgi:ribonucleoside-diphosphate reductase alpha chain